MSQDDAGLLLGVTASRICQVINGPIKKAIEAVHVIAELADLYHDDPEYSKFAVDWIRL